MISLYTFFYKLRFCLAMINVLANVFKVCMKLNCTFNQRKKNKKLHCYNIQSNSMFDDYQMVQK